MPSDEQESSIAEIEAGIAELLRSAGTAIDFTAVNIDGGSTTGTVRIVNESGDHESTERLVSEVNESVVIVTENVLVGDVLHARIRPEDVPPADVGWTSVEPGPLREQLVGEAYTASGTAGASLERLVALLRDVPWTLEGSAETEVEGQRLRSVLVRFEAEEIRRYFRDTGLERTGPAPARGSAFYEFWIDQETGALARLLAGGTLFQDGEPLEGAEVEIVYSPMDDLVVDAPVDRSE